MAKTKNYEKKDGTRTCYKCKETKPLTDEFWYRDFYQQGGNWHSKCKACAKAYSKAQYQRRKEMKAKLAQA